MGISTLEVGYTTPPPEGRPRSSGEHVVALGEEEKKLYKKICDLVLSKLLYFQLQRHSPAISVL
jgi:hypothetical protein